MMMTKIEIAEAQQALIAWLESQEIGMGDATAMMTDLVGIVIGRVAPNPQELRHGIDVTSKLLAASARVAFSFKIERE